LCPTEYTSVLPISLYSSYDTHSNYGNNNYNNQHQTKKLFDKQRKERPELRTNTLATNQEVSEMHLGETLLEHARNCDQCINRYKSVMLNKHLTVATAIRQADKTKR